MSWKTNAMLVLAVMGGVLGLGALNDAARDVSKQHAQDNDARAARQAASELEAEIAGCKQTLEGRLAEYSALMAKKQFWPASLTIRRCAEAMKDEVLLKSVADAERRSYVADVESPTVSRPDKLRSLEAMAVYYPDLAQRYQGMRKRLEGQEAKTIEAGERKRRQTDPPAIGSTMKQVAEAGWGYPSAQNRTVTARGEYVQWVYEGGRYIYFENGVVVSWQD